MHKKPWRYFIYGWMLILLACTKPYEPPEVNTDIHLLVVDGFITCGTEATTTIFLSRSRKLTDSVINKPETGAQVQIEVEGGSHYPLQETVPGQYSSPPLSLNTNGVYRLRIIAANKEYVSDFIQGKQTPPIDSLNWKQENDVRVFANTHDPQNNTRYYRWEFTETWEYHSFYDAYLEYRNGQIIFRDSADHQKVCWSTAHSTDILLGSSVNLTNDVIYQAPVALVPQGSSKLGNKYSIQVRQYALSEQAFNYWSILQKNTEQQGGLFDAQPSQLVGNIRCITDPGEIAIGYISASTVQEKRIYIKRSEVTNWTLTDPGPLCEPQFISPSQASIYLSDGLFAPAYFVTGGGIAIARKECVDCTSRGGTNKKPSFWQ